MKNALKKIYFTFSLFLLAAGPVLAMAQRPSSPDAPPPPAWVSWAPIAFMLFIFYFLLIRPQSKARKERQSLLDNLKKGDRIVTQGGIHATIVSSGQGTLDIKINEDTKITISRSGVADVVKEEVKEPEVVKS